MGFVGCIPRFLKAHGGWILTLLGIGGFVGTTVLVANETPDAKEAVLDAWLEKQRETGDDETELTVWETIKAGAPSYLPSILLGGGTIGCMVSAQIFNMKQQAALVTALGALATQFDQYRDVIRAEHGEEADKRALALSKKKIEELKEEIQRLKEANGPYLYGISTLPGVIFEAKPVDVQEAIMHFNRNLILGGENCLTELYEFLRLPESCYNRETSDAYGYNQYENEVDFDFSYVDFDIIGVFSKSGRMINMITPTLVPYRIDNWNAEQADTYGMYEELPGYDFSRAKHLAESYLEQNQLTRINPPVITVCNLFARNSQQKHLF